MLLQGVRRVNDNLLEEVKPVFTEKLEFDFWDESILLAFFLIFRTNGILMR